VGGDFLSSTKREGSIKSWAEYAARWELDKDWVEIEDRSIGPAERDGYFVTLGDEWGTKACVDQFVADFVYPHITADSIVLEIGSGGGRVARRVAPQCALLICADIEIEMLRMCRSATRGFPNVVPVVVPETAPMIPIPDERLDFIYGFDTFVHMDQRTLFRYLLEASRTLRSGAKAVFHVATHETPKGWEHFMKSIRAGFKQGQFGSFEYIDSRAFVRMASAAGFATVCTTVGRGGNFYYERDMVFLFERL
jgi:SAM-dependent methyltransferase